MIELSADMGEGAPRENEIWPLIDAASVACGGHTGDDASMAEAVRLALEHGIVLGAHPSYPDRENFGRHPMAIGREELAASIEGQISNLRAIALMRGLRLQRVKPHGALYNEAHRDYELAKIIVEVMRRVDTALALVCSATSQMARAAREAGTAVVREAFADRRYQNDGSLTPRSQEGSLLSVAEAVEQAALLARESSALSAAGRRVALEFDTLCVHSDMPGAVERLEALRTLPEFRH